MDNNGVKIEENDVEFLVIEDDKLPLLKNVSGDFDEGESLRHLLEAEKNLLQNNFPQVVMAHAASSIAANYDLVVTEFDGCATPVLKGHPVSGKTTALKAVLSVFGQTHFSSESSSKYLESKQSKTTIPFGWDDASCMKTLKAMVVNSYNACGSATLRTTYRPHTVPIVTTNMDCNDLKIKSRWLRIPFEELVPKLKGMQRIQAEAELRSAMQSANKSLSVVTSCIHRAIENRLEDDDFIEIVSLLEEECAKMRQNVDQRAQNMFCLMLFCAKKILQLVNLEVYYQDVWEKTINLVIPSYLNPGTSNSSEGASTSIFSSEVHNSVENYLKVVLVNTVLKANKDDVLQFFDQDYTPTKCLCGESITFNVTAAISFVEQNCTTEVPPISAPAIRFFIKSNKIGCVGNQVRFRNNDKQCHAAHVQKIWFKPEDIKALDEKLGKRRKGKKSKVTATVTVDHTEHVEPDKNHEVDLALRIQNEALQNDKVVVVENEAQPNDEVLVALQNEALQSDEEVALQNEAQPSDKEVALQTNEAQPNDEVVALKNRAQQNDEVVDSQIEVQPNDDVIALQNEALQNDEVVVLENEAQPKHQNQGKGHGKSTSAATKHTATATGTRKRRGCDLQDSLHHGIMTEKRLRNKKQK